MARAIIGNHCSPISIIFYSVIANVSPSSRILVTLLKDELRFSETSLPTRATRRHIPEDSILYSLRSENLKSYILVISLTCYEVASA
jgi:hypothetical protein